MRLRLLFAVAPTLLLACQEPPHLGDRDSQRRWLAEHGRPPTDYVLAAFAEHDVVLLGEHHLIHENAAFVADLIPHLHAAGVHALASEFVKRAQTDELQRLLRAESFDEEAALDLLRELPNPLWGHREYLDIWRATHSVNADRAQGEPWFEIHGLDNGWSQGEAIRRRGERRWQMQRNLDREQCMVEVVEALLAQDRKILVHIGWAHTIVCHGERLGTRLREAHGGRVHQVALHFDLHPQLTEHLEAVCAPYEQGIGFATKDSPFAAMVVPGAMPFRMIPDSTLTTFAEGYVFLAPLADLRPTQWIPGFVDTEHYEEALFVARGMRYLEGVPAPETVADLDRALADRYPGHETPR